MHTRVMYFRIPCNSIEIAAPVNQGILSRQVSDSQIQSRMPLYQVDLVFAFDTSKRTQENGKNIMERKEDK